MPHAPRIAAPVRGAIASIAIKASQSVEEGDVLTTLEAMKMETAIHAPQSGQIAEVFVQAGAQVDAKDLLATYVG